MAIVVTLLGTNQDKATSRTVDLAVSGIASGDFLFIIAVSDSPLSVDSYTDYRYYYDGTTLQDFDAVDVEALNTGGVNVGIARLKVSNASEAGASVRFNDYSSTLAHAISVYKVTGLAATPLDKTSTGIGTGVNASTGSTGLLTQNDELVIGATGIEDEIDDAHGTWTTGTGYVSGNEQFDATNGGGDASNIQVHSVAKVVADGTSQAYQGVDAGHDSSDWAAAIATYKMAVAGGTTYDETGRGFVSTVSSRFDYCSFLNELDKKQSVISLVSHLSPMLMKDLDRPAMSYTKQEAYDDLIKAATIIIELLGLNVFSNQGITDRADINDLGGIAIISLSQKIEKLIAYELNKIQTSYVSVEELDDLISSIITVISEFLGLNVFSTQGIQDTFIMNDLAKKQISSILSQRFDSSEMNDIDKRQIASVISQKIDSMIMRETDKEQLSYIVCNKQELLSAAEELGVKVYAIDEQIDTAIYLDAHNILIIGNTSETDDLIVASIPAGAVTPLIIKLKRGTSAPFYPQRLGIKYG